jgi:hypothetical protein
MEQINDNLENSDEEFINIEHIISTQTKNNVYQIQVTNENILIKLVCTETFIPDVIIKENFGSNNDLSLYSCLFEQNDFNKYNLDILYPLIKLQKKNNSIIKNYAIAVKFKNKIIFDIQSLDFDIFFVSNINDNQNIIVHEIDKNITPTNIIEKLFEYYIIQNI